MRTIQSALVVAAASLFAAGCSLGQGSGDVSTAPHTKLFARDCWDDAYNLRPDFFASIPYRDQQELRIQRGTQLEEVSDGLSILIDSTSTIRDAIADSPKSFDVSLPVGVHPPGTPVEPPIVRQGGQAPIVHMALYLQYSCHNQNTILYSIGGTITFNALFDGNPDEADAAQKFTQATFDVMIGDPNDAPLGEDATQIPANLQSELVGDFQFYFERGQPGQPFP